MLNWIQDTQTDLISLSATAPDGREIRVWETVAETEWLWGIYNPITQESDIGAAASETVAKSLVEQRLATVH